MSRICVRALFPSGRSRLLVFRGEGAKYFKLFCKFVLGRRRRRLHHLGAECLRQQRSDKLELIVRLLLAQLPDPARAMTREIGLECTHERFPESAVANSTPQQVVACGSIETFGHGPAPWLDGGLC